MLHRSKNTERQTAELLLIIREKISKENKQYQHILSTLFELVSDDEITGVEMARICFYLEDHDIHNFFRGNIEIDEFGNCDKKQLLIKWLNDMITAEIQEQMEIAFDLNPKSTI